MHSYLEACLFILHHPLPSNTVCAICYVRAFFSFYITGFAQTWALCQGRLKRRQKMKQWGMIKKKCDSVKWRVRFKSRLKIVINLKWCDWSYRPLLWRKPDQPRGQYHMRKHSRNCSWIKRLLTRTQYKRTGHWWICTVMLSRLYFSTISKYYSQ